MVVLVAVIGMTFFLVTRTPKTKSAPASERNRAQPVSVAVVATQDVPVWVSAMGTAVPIYSVTVRSRVDGELMRVHFNEGDSVKRGQLLAEIDPRSFQAQLSQAQAQLARNQALLDNARADLARYQMLWSKDAIAKQQLDTQASLVRQYQATVDSDVAVVENAKLQLSYTRISAPVAGRLGLRQVDPGNQVRSSDEHGLVSITQVAPMTVVFSVPENVLSDIRQRLAQKEAMLVEAWDAEQKHVLAQGRLLATDNQIDVTTGTLKLKSVFPNTDQALFPNQFVNARLRLGTQKNATVIPLAAVVRGAKGSLVYVVGESSSVTSVPVTLGEVDGDVVAVTGALKPGQRVVVDGIDKLRDGAKVEVMSPDKPQPKPQAQ